MASFFSIWVFWAALFGCLTLHQFESHGSLGCMEEERIGLLKLKEAFNYPNRSALPSWSSETEKDCCKWENVTCASTSKRVVQLSLSDIRDPTFTYSNEENYWYLDLSLFSPFQQLRNLSLQSNFLKDFTGELRSSKLEYLDLGWNCLTEIPPFLSGIKSLKVLNLIGNGLTNLSRFEGTSQIYQPILLPLFHSFVVCDGFTGELRSSKLEDLDLSYNSLTEIPPFLSGIKSLKVLNLRENQLTNLSHFEDLITLSALKALSFASNQLTALPKGICMLRNLEELDLSRNSLTGVIPSCLTNLTSLKLLDLSWNYLVGNIPSTLFQGLKSLEYVSLSGNLFEGLFSLSSISSNSKLEVFELDCRRSELVVDTENPPWTPLFQLKVLHLSNCKLNEPTGATPSFLVNQYDLRVLDLSNNSMKGKVPSWLFQNNPNLESLSLRHNLFTGPFLLHSDKRNLNMSSLDISSNRIREEFPDSIASVLPNLLSLDMSANMFHGSIPPSMGDMKRLISLDLSNNNLSGEIPEHLVVGCTSLMSLTLSNNFLRGPLLPAKSNLTNLSFLKLDNNHFSGELSYSLLNSKRLKWLDISSNVISGEIPDWLGNFSELGSLHLSNNSFESPVPASFCKLKQLSFLDLSRNKFSGFVPSCFNLTSLKYLHLQGNNFTGSLPHTLSASPSLVTLDLRDNRLSGEIPDWISSLSNLRVLLLKNNHLDGSIPSEICHLKNISILDLSFNKFAGLIPSCLYQIPFGSRRTFDYTFQTDSFGWKSESYSYDNELHVSLGGWLVMTIDAEEEFEFMSKSRNENYRGSILYYMSGVDLSQNDLTGDIPNELGYLTGIHTLNLSHNHLTGSIPRSFANLKQIESLDLSFNRLSGQIPTELTQLYSLSVFSVAHNNLSGSVPDRKGQFGTFNESSYEGNPLLCGPPLEKNCTGSGQSSLPLVPPESGEEESFRHAFLMAFLVSYFPAFVGAISFLYIKAYCRERKLMRARRGVSPRRML